MVSLLFASVEQLFKAVTANPDGMLWGPCTSGNGRAFNEGGVGEYFRDTGFTCEWTDMGAVGYTWEISKSKQSGELITHDSRSFTGAQKLSWQQH